MEKLSNPKKTIETVRAHEFATRKRFGQNFLVDGSVIDRILEAAGSGPEDCVLEIGPGIGTLTQYLAERAGHVAAVEIDRDLIPILEDTLRAYDNVTVINRDILKTDLEEIAREYGGGRPLKVVANLPYYITTPIVMSLLEGRAPLESMTVMVQKEVADRMLAKSGTREYGALSLAVRYYARPSVAAVVPPSSFYPRPKVDSAVVHLEMEGMPCLAVRDEKKMFALIRASFNQRRKTLINGIGNAAGLPVTKEQAARALGEMGLKETVRGEQLTLEQFARLSDLLFPGEEGI